MQRNTVFAFCLKAPWCHIDNVYFKLYIWNLAATCSLLTAPDNGNINCSLGRDGVSNIGDTCSFTCDNGFRLIGNQSRTCVMRRNSGRWSGKPAKCRACKLSPQ